MALTFLSNIKVQSPLPTDWKYRVDAKAELLSILSNPINYPYLGMLAYVANDGTNNGLYLLEKEPDLMIPSNAGITFTDWKKLIVDVYTGLSTDAKPVLTVDDKGTMFLSTDNSVLAIWDGAAWVDVSGGGGGGTFISLTDTPAGVSNDQILTTDPATGEVIYTAKNTAFNLPFGVLDDIFKYGTRATEGANDAGGLDKVARIDHIHDGRYYTVPEVNDMLTAISGGGITHTWPYVDDMVAQSGMLDGDLGLLISNKQDAGSPPNVAYKSMYVYRYNFAITTWEEMYPMAQIAKADEVEMSSDILKVFDVTASIGGYAAGDTIATGTVVYDILKKILAPTVGATYTEHASSFVMTETGSGIYEVGTDYGSVFSAPLSRTYSTGIITSKDTPQSADVGTRGAVTGTVYSYVSGPMATVDAVTGAVTGKTGLGTTVFKADITYGAGVGVYADNEGNPTPVINRSGGTDSHTDSVVGQYKVFALIDGAGTEAIATIRAAAVSYFEDANKKYDSAKTFYYWGNFTVPAGAADVAVYTREADISFYDAIYNVEYPTVSNSFTMKDASNVDVTYYKHTLDLGVGFSSDHKGFQIKIN